ncbi:aminotransferase class V-fold PLP-dependent enzyme [Falsihalocynthiibacter arcticus]|uniref:Class V aminotransferase n=1 Tax=Falsihalocynthiibacter arcticus TaxID=1579316 RepID=A0A126V4K7_9RHOB|nr:aminotransferase class V-fold PLP-dependent enzyme [Falsihalocynthiibacter arcticus]AML53087.1 class V aminotransferase [Falsihalocynthiibacter arcticus]
MTHQGSTVDPDGLAEFSVVFTDRSLNHMSKSFQRVMNDISGMLKSVYAAQGVALVPSGGTYAMEAVARQFVNNRKALVIRNGWFSYRWTQIFEAGDIPASSTVLKARRTGNHHQAPFSPPPIQDVVKTILDEQPDVVFAPHVETSSGIMLTEDYIREITTAVHSYGGMFVLDCIASGTVWLNMDDLGIDVLISAPQKGWSASPSSGLVMMNDLAIERLGQTQSTSFSCDLAKWFQIMQAYENGGHAYHATMPTDALAKFRDAMLEAKEIGFDTLKSNQLELGVKTRELLVANGFPSVAAEGFAAPGVVVSYTDDPAIQNGAKFSSQGMQIAAGVPLQCDEPEDFRTFRLGLFGLDKLQDVDRAVDKIRTALSKLK